MARFFLRLTRSAKSGYNEGQCTCEKSNIITRLLQLRGLGLRGWDVDENLKQGFPALNES